jgi:vacuolar-type H+-ATPase subunit H
MSQRSAPQPQDGTADIIYLVDRLEELVGIGKRVPFSGRVMVEEMEFLALVDQLRVAVPNEIKQAQRVIRERERIIGEAQDEAVRIVQVARERADALVSQHSIVNEARQRGEEILRAAEEAGQRARGEVDIFLIEQFQLVEDAIRRGMAVMEDAVEQTLETVSAAKDAVGN